METFYYKVGIFDNPSESIAEWKRWELQFNHSYKSYLSSCDKLNNEGFINNAPKDIIQLEYKKRDDSLRLLTSITGLLNKQLDMMIKYYM